MKASSLSTFIIICIGVSCSAQNAAADNNKEISQEIWDEEIDRIKDEVLSDFENWQEKENNGNNGQDHRRLLDPLCRRARSLGLVDWGESFNNRGEESFNNNPLLKEIEKRCCEPVTTTAATTTGTTTTQAASSTTDATTTVATTSSSAAPDSPCEGIDTSSQCSICGVGSEVGNPDPTVDLTIAGFGSTTTCGDFQQGGLDGNTDIFNACGLITALLPELQSGGACGCTACPTTSSTAASTSTTTVSTSTSTTTSTSTSTSTVTSSTTTTTNIPPTSAPTSNPTSAPTSSPIQSPTFTKSSKLAKTKGDKRGKTGKTKTTKQGKGEKAELI